MGIPDWARPCEPCVCVDESWRTEFDNGDSAECVGPEVDDIVTITEAAIKYGVPCIRIAEWGGDWWELAGFRPLTSLESDRRMFSELLHVVGEKIGGDRQVVPA